MKKQLFLQILLLAFLLAMASCGDDNSDFIARGDDSSEEDGSSDSDGDDGSSSSKKDDSSSGKGDEPGSSSSAKENSSASDGDEPEESSSSVSADAPKLLKIVVGAGDVEGEIDQDAGTVFLNMDYGTDLDLRDLEVKSFETSDGATIDIKKG